MHFQKSKSKLHRFFVLKNIVFLQINLCNNSIFIKLLFMLNSFRMVNQIKVLLINYRNLYNSYSVFAFSKTLLKFSNCKTHQRCSHEAVIILFAIKPVKYNDILYRLNSLFEVKINKVKKKNSQNRFTILE